MRSIYQYLEDFLFDLIKEKEWQTGDKFTTSNILCAAYELEKSKESICIPLHSLFHKYKIRCIEMPGYQIPQFLLREATHMLKRIAFDSPLLTIDPWSDSVFIIQGLP